MPSNRLPEVGALLAITATVLVATGRCGSDRLVRTSKRLDELDGTVDRTHRVRRHFSAATRETAAGEAGRFDGRHIERRTR